MTAPNILARKRIEAAAGPVPLALPTDVQPGLRFLLSQEARDEALALYRLLREDLWRREGWLAGWMTRRMPTECPNMMRADEALRGLLTDALRHVAAHPTIPAWWLSVAVGVANGRPDRLRESCETILAWRPAGAAPVADDEGGDRLWHERLVVRQTVAGQRGRGRWAADWDQTDDEALAEQEGFDFSQLRPTGEVSTEIPF
ncbi:MAG: hypothetical protein KF723_03610 [Rhizobiaceae bacterium]|nr:hypothetical protein [Rhizobiaceae bacterium]